MTTMTTTSATPRRHERWANLRHAIIGALLAAPPDRGELRAALDALAARTYLHPITGAPVQFAFSTIERWLHLARKAAGHGDTVRALRRKIRKDANLTLEVLNHATQAWVEMEYNRARHSEIREAPADRFMRGPEVGRPSPSAEELRGAFRIEERRTQRRSDGTVTIAGVRYELPSRYRTLERLSVRYATWDLAAVHLVDDKSGAVLAPLYPLDRTRNGTQSRRLLAEVAPLAGIAAPPTRPPQMAPLLRQLITAYDASGLPPAYVPKDVT